MDFFSEPEKTLSEGEKRFKEPLNKATAELMSACYGVSQKAGKIANKTNRA